MVLAQRNRVPEAITAFNSALRVDPTNGAAYLQLALALERSGRHQEALSAAREAEKLGEQVPAPLLAPTAGVPPPPSVACPGEKVSLDDGHPDYTAYLEVVRARIRQNWIYPRALGEQRIGGDLLLEFRIVPDGRVDCLVLHRSTGFPELDEAAMTAVRKAQPFPPLPDRLGDRPLDIRSSFRYQIEGTSLPTGK